MTAQTLVLNSHWQPINVVPSLKAVMKVFAERAMFLHPDTFVTYNFEDWVLEWSDAVKEAKIDANRIVPLGGLSLVLPEVVICSSYGGVGYRATAKCKPKFSRRNLYIRDRNICCYCGKRFPTDKLTMDHVTPRSKGGISSWENVVLACAVCNGRKADKTPKEAGLTLIRKPFQPTMEDLRLTPAERIKMNLRSKPPKTWEQFLGKMYWSVELNQE